MPTKVVVDVPAGTTLVKGYESDAVQPESAGKVSYAKVANAHDDFERETSFYQQALLSVNVFRQKVLSLGKVFRKPADFFADMFKNSTHMSKIKKIEEDKQEAAKKSTLAKQQRLNKKFGKQVQIEKIQERQKKKRDTIEKIESFKKKRRNAPDSTRSLEDDFDVQVGGAEDNSAPSQKRSGNKQSADAPNKKRQFKNEKYGFGGKKRGMKRNDAKSTNDTSSFSATRNKTPFKNSGGIQKNRPGKASRNKQNTQKFQKIYKKASA